MLHFTHQSVTEQEKDFAERLSDCDDLHTGNDEINKHREKLYQSFLTEYSRKETRIAELESEIARMKEAEGKRDQLIIALEEYQLLLCTEIAGLVGLANVHSWQSSLVQEGIDAREKIKQLKESISPPKP